ncbi:MAG: hypothetical protein D6752_02925 [Candidatus Nitrosothermus koennekii]|nr:MAG: hypothetical protein D6752_02925 [Candidatus Nitrosothermus koennekii]
MRIIPLASESLGVRSLSVFIETKDIKILLDAGVSLAIRYRLLPHTLEYQALKEARRRIKEYAKKADIITISHYHFDHYTQTYDSIEPKFTWSSIEEAGEIYADKQILAKDISKNINYSQKKRGYVFNKRIKRFTDKLAFIDDKILEFGSTRITVSKPLPHGEDNTPLGYVLAYTIDDGNTRLLYASDTQLLSKKSIDYIIDKKPDIVITSAVPTYLRIDEKIKEEGLRNLEMLARNTKLIVDHHIMREKNSLDYIKPLRRYDVKTFAEYLGLKNNLLEANRVELYKKFPPSNHFQQWIKNPSSLPPL